MLEQAPGEALRRLALRNREPEYIVAALPSDADSFPLEQLEKRARLRAYRSRVRATCSSSPQATTEARAGRTPAAPSPPWGETPSVP